MKWFSQPRQRKRYQKNSMDLSRKAQKYFDKMLLFKEHSHLVLSDDFYIRLQRETTKL